MTRQELAQTSESLSILEAEAAEHFVLRTLGQLSPVDQCALELRLQSDRAYAAAFMRAQKAWSTVAMNATAPELMQVRSGAVSRMRRNAAR